MSRNTTRCLLADPDCCAGRAQLRRLGHVAHVAMWPCGKRRALPAHVLPRSKAVESTLSGKLVRMACISWSEMGQPLEVCYRRVITTLRLESIRDALALLLLGPGVGLEIALRRPAALAIGRAPDNDVVVDHPSVSRHHARI